MTSGDLIEHVAWATMIKLDTDHDIDEFEQ